MTFKPMLSATLSSVDQLVYPVLASPKLDGIRALVRDGQLVTRSLKPVANNYIRGLFSYPHFNGLDGELIVGKAGAHDVFLRSSSGVMSREGTPEVTFFVFDCFNNPEKKYVDRLQEARRLATGSAKIVVVDHAGITSQEELTAYELECLGAGFEGVMVRGIESPYKYGRGTLGDQDLMKLKRFADAEAEVVGMEEQMANLNEATTDNLGHTKRSTHKAGKQGKDTLGALIVRGLNGPYKGRQFNIGSGFTDAQRVEIWNDHRSIGAPVTGRVVKYKYFPSGSKDAPRFPVFLGFRDRSDMS